MIIYFNCLLSYYTFILHTHNKNQFKTELFLKVILHTHNKNQFKTEQFLKEVPPRLELGLLDSKSSVITIAPRDRLSIQSL